MNKSHFRTMTLACALLFAGGCAQGSQAETISEASVPTAPSLDAQFQSILTEHGIATAGAAKIQNGEIVWTGYYGEQVPGVPASRTTMFNVGSISKTIAAETILRLASDGALSLDEPMAPNWSDPDIVEDPRHETLTARMMLTHRSGFPNWRYTDPEFKLRFVRDPDVSFGYSGEGLEYVAKFAENKVQISFPELAKERVFGPLKLTSTSLGPQEWVMDRIVQPVGEDGVRHKPFCTDASEWRCAPNGEWSAADELAVTVEDYAKFLIAVMNGNGVSDALHQDRLTIQTSTADDEILRCNFRDRTQCPLAQGYGLGWEIFEFDDAKIVSHGGSDWSERAIAYFDTETRNGIVLFFNGPASSSTQALIDGMNVLDPGAKMAMLYEGWVDTIEKRQATGGAD